MSETADMRTRALEAARGFLGTPYRYQGSRAGIGCDCLGLVRGVWRALYGHEPEAPGAYTSDWAVRGGPDRLLDAARRHLTAIDAALRAPGDVVLFSWRAGGPASHCGIFDAASGATGPLRLIHAYEGAAVVSSAMPNAWERRIAGVFRFPE